MKLQCLFYAKLVIFFAFLVMKTETQESNCEATYPSSYAYVTSTLLTSNGENGNCNQRSMYTFCSHPIILTDGQIGPEEFNANISGVYYKWRQVATQILFTFQRRVLFTAIDLYYYIDNATKAGLPKLRVYLVEDSFTISDTARDQPSATIDPVGSPNGRQIITADLSAININTRQVLFRIEAEKSYKFTPSEVRFCTSGTPTITTTTTTTIGATTRSTIRESSSTNGGTLTTEPINGQVTLQINITCIIMVFVLLMLW